MDKAEPVRGGIGRAVSTDDYSADWPSGMTVSIALDCALVNRQLHTDRQACDMGPGGEHNGACHTGVPPATGCRLTVSIAV